jgi:hypothetical protein
MRCVLLRVLVGRVGGASTNPARETASSPFLRGGEEKARVEWGTGLLLRRISPSATGQRIRRRQCADRRDARIESCTTRPSSASMVKVIGSRTSARPDCYLLPAKRPGTNEEGRAPISVRCAVDTNRWPPRLVLNLQSELRSQCSFPAVGQAKRSTIASPHDPTQLESSVGQGDTKCARQMVPTLAPIKTAFGKWLALDQNIPGPHLMANRWILWR